MEAEIRGTVSSAGALIVVPSACLTKTLTQQLAVYSPALDNSVCSSVRPQITLVLNQKLSQVMFVDPRLLTGWRWRGGG